MLNRTVLELPPTKLLETKPLPFVLDTSKKGDCDDD